MLQRMAQRRKKKRKSPGALSLLWVEPRCTATYNVKLLLPPLEAAGSSGECTRLQWGTGSRPAAPGRQSAAQGHLRALPGRVLCLSCSLLPTKRHCWLPNYALGSQSVPTAATGRLFVSTASHEHGSLCNQYFISILASTTIANRKTISWKTVKRQPQIHCCTWHLPRLFVTLCNEEDVWFYPRLKLACFQLSLHHYI